MRNKLSSLRNNNGMRNEEGEIKSAVRTNLISTRSFSFDQEQGMECQSFKHRKRTQVQGEVARGNSNPRTQNYAPGLPNKIKITEEKQKEKQWSSNKTETMVKIRMSR